MGFIIAGYIIIVVLLMKSGDQDKRVKATGYDRLLLHANYLEFKYQNVIYKIYSKQILS